LMAAVCGLPFVSQHTQALCLLDLVISPSRHASARSRGVMGRAQLAANYRMKRDGLGHRGFLGIDTLALPRWVAATRLGPQLMRGR
jgi:hypothetical protein